MEIHRFPHFSLNLQEDNIKKEFYVKRKTIFA